MMVGQKVGPWRKLNGTNVTSIYILFFLLEIFSGTWSLMESGVFFSNLSPTSDAGKWFIPLPQSLM